MSVSAVLTAFLTALLVGCASFQPKVIDSMVDGTRVIQHIDTDDAPKDCGDRVEWAGCHKIINGVSNIWHTSIVPEHIIAHELGHSKGMKHGSWKRDFSDRPCSIILVSGGKYKIGQMICLTHRGEDVYADNKWSALK